MFPHIKERSPLLRSHNVFMYLFFSLPQACGCSTSCRLTSHEDETTDLHSGCLYIPWYLCCDGSTLHPCYCTTGWFVSSFRVTSLYRSCCWKGSTSSGIVSTSPSWRKWFHSWRRGCGSSDQSWIPSTPHFSQDPCWRGILPSELLWRVCG